MRKLFAITPFLLLAALACSKPSASSGGAEDYKAESDKIKSQMCGKMEECMQEMMKGMPENMRQMMSAKFSKESCMAQASAVPQKDKPENFTKEDMEAAKACGEAMAKASCTDIKNHNVAGCEKFMNK